MSSPEAARAELRADIIRRAEALTRAQEINNAAARRRRVDEPPDANLRERARTWRQAREAFAHAKAEDRIHPEFTAWAIHERTAARRHEAEQAMYPPETGEAIARLRKGSRDDVEWALTFLEADPWCFRSGYLKEQLLRHLPRLELTTEERDRLIAVLMRHIDAGDRREFRSTCRAARRLDGPDIRAAVRQRLLAGDRGVQRRALWMWTALDRDPLDPETLAAARAVVSDAALDPLWWRTSDWVRILLPRLEDAAWRDELLRCWRAAVDPSRCDAALRLVTRLADHGVASEDRPALESRLLRAVEHDDFPGFEGVGHLLWHVHPSTSLIDTLSDHERAPDDKRSFRAHLALRAMGDHVCARRRTKP